MSDTRILGWLGLAAALMTTPSAAQEPAPPAAPVQAEQAPFVLIVAGLTSANQAAVQAELAKVPTVAKVTVDAVRGKVFLATGAGMQLDTEAAKAAAVQSGVTVQSVELPAWSTETVWVVQAKGGA